MDLTFEIGRALVMPDEEREALLVRVDGALVAVLTRVLPEETDGEMVEWHLEAGLGPCATSTGTTFANLADATVWIEERLNLARVRNPRRRNPSQG